MLDSIQKSKSPLITHAQKLQVPLISQSKLNKSKQLAQIQETEHIPESNHHKNFVKLTLIVIIISLSSFYFGFSLTYIESIPNQILRQYYGSIMDSSVIHQILIGAMPIGAMFGSMLVNPLMQKIMRRNFLIIVNIFALIVNLIIQITNIWVLLSCRLANGILVGLYMGIVPIYIHELSPHSISGFFGSFTQMQHLLGNVVSYLFGMIFYLAGIQNGFLMRFQFQFTSILVLLQLILIWIGYVPESPSSLIQRNKIQEAKIVLRMFNQQKQIDRLIEEKAFQVGAKSKQQQVKQIQYKQLNIQQTIQQQAQKDTQELSQIQVMTWKSYFLSFQLPLTQQLTGINFLVTQLTTITAIYDQEMSHYTALIANVIQFVATLFSAYLIDRIGRRTIILSGNLSIGILNILIGIVFYALDFWKWEAGFTVGMILIMLLNVIFGLTLGPVVWLYIPQIAPPKLVPFATAMYWFGCSICVIIAPIITTQIKSPYLIFLILGIYLLVVFVPNYYLVTQTKDLSAQQINQQFKTK